ncbi:MAG: hypothetical protein OXH81_03185 [Gemmatimonadetes bacterium]|nr:hypothetical protein [Gemmatimonadota bacterium]
MSITIHNKKISRVMIVDDDPEARVGYGYPVEDLGLEPVMMEGPVDTAESFVAEAEQLADAVVCDYHLKKHDYAKCDGDILVAECHKAGIPGMLCTTFTDVNVTIRRDCLRYIPALLKTNSPEPEALTTAWSKGLCEIGGTFHPTRKPRRTLVRVAEVDEEGRYLYAIVPAWDPQQKIRLYEDSLSDEIRDLVEPGRRFHALVNIGAESHEDLFFDDWESK